MKDAEKGIYSNCVAVRKVKDTLRDSVFEQLTWAIEMLGVSNYWHVRESPLALTYIPTEQKILFRSALLQKDLKKIKSTKFKRGYCKYIWYEEVDEFDGMEEIRNINQTLLRGGAKFFAFYSYNAPKSKRNWINEEALIERDDKYKHHSTYLSVPRHWLGEQFFIEAEHLKKVNPSAYEHEYEGKVTGTGGEIFSNLTLRKIPDEELKTFDKIYRGIDWGYAVDPFHYTVNYYDSTRRKLYIFFEHHQVQLSNSKAIELVKAENISNGIITCDSAEPKSIRELKDNGLRPRAAKKGPDSIEYGIKWLQDLEEIVIDSDRCPNTAREFSNYELEKDSNGNFKGEYPDKDNHSIDSVRYSQEENINARRIKFFK
jgi:PBSX family phage terminase large subunit